jgi:hypothetical protein
MKKTEKTANLTSFHNHTFRATLKEVMEILGEPVHSDNDGLDKVNFEWDMETESGNVFTVYDWKVYEPLKMDDEIIWHIGSHNSLISAEALEEIKKEFNKTIHTE